MKVSAEAKVGFMVMIGFTLFIVMVGLLSDFNINRQGYKLHLYFTFLNDLNTGAPVKIGGGIKIGEVTEINQSGDKTEVVLWIENKYRLSKSSTFAIFTTGIIGEKYINVIVPAIIDNEGVLQDGDIKYGLDPASFDRMMQTFQSFLQDQDGGELLANIFSNSNAFVENLNALISENRDDVNGTVVLTKSTVENLSLQTRILMTHVNKIAKNMSELSEENKNNVNITLRNLSEISTSLNTLTKRMESGRGTVGRLMYDEEVYNNLRDASIYAKDLFYDLKQDPSKLFFKSNR
jgi:phospholipid/cholesterol/gamma-HCH transport system substrate-binding protein